MGYRAWDLKRRLRKLKFDEPRKKRALEDVDPRMKQVALNRLAVLRELNLRIQARAKSRSKSKREVIENFLTDFNSGMLAPCGPDGVNFIRHLARSTLYLWQRKHKDGGLAALVPGYKIRVNMSGKATYRELNVPFEMKFPGPPRRNGKAFFIERIKRRWKHDPVDFPIKVALYYTVPVFRGASMELRRKMLKREVGHVGTPHLDALNAFVIGCLEGIVFKSHSRIIQLYSEKKIGWWPQTRVLISRA